MGANRAVSLLGIASTLLLLLLVACSGTSTSPTAGPLPAVITEESAPTSGRLAYPEPLALGRPPEPSARFVAADGFELFSASADGQLYACTTYKAANGEECWRPVGQLPDLFSVNACFDGQSVKRQPFDSPVEQLLASTEWQDDGYMQNCFIRLADGTIWKMDCGGGWLKSYAVEPPAGPGDNAPCP